MVVETNDLAGQRELIAEYLQNEVMKPLQDLAKTTLSERKRLMNNGVELHRELKESMEQLERVSHTYWPHPWIIICCAFQFKSIKV